VADARPAHPSAAAGGTLATLHAWRHPKPIGAEGRCIGARTDLPVDPRKAKRLAHRIRQLARREQLPRAAATSPLRRCRDVGRWLRRFGFRCLVDARLAEVDFGRWEGQRWEDIVRLEIDAWAAELDGYAPGGGECVRELLVRVGRVLSEPPARLLITHGGWLSGALWLQTGHKALPDAASWPRAPATGASVRLRSSAGTD
jgi:alpha-ribazole phosphatase